MATKNFTVRVGQDEIGHILDRKENLDHHGQMWDYMSRYQALGWDLAIITAHGGADLELDLGQPREVWWRQLADLGLNGVQLNLAIRTGQRSNLLVLEVNKGGGNLSLDLLGEWRAQCVAELGNCREQHYYALPPGSQAPPSFFLAREVLIYGEEGLILAPPSIEPDDREPWNWLTPPWENPPQAPKPAVWQYIREQMVLANPTASIAPTWDEIYRIIVPHEPVLRALLVPPSNIDNYYRNILMAATAVGLKDQRILLGLLWHAPYGDACHDEAGWQRLQDLLARENLDPGGSSPVLGPWVDGGPAALGGWPGWGPPPQSLALTRLPEDSQSLPAGMGEITRQLLGETDFELWPPKFEKTVSGQFFQLLAALGERVISDSCRNEAILAGIEPQATEAERLAAEIEQCLTPPTNGSNEPKSTSCSTGERGPMECPWSGAIAPQRQKNRKFQEVKAMVQDFLSKNTDLAEDRDKVQMVLFSLKNYVSINPEYAGLSFRDKLEKAGQMARSFLKQPAEA
ncbi:MAG: hypothetical protein NTY36_09330 [Deltaproteobacteria bacterium]|nr:hypothetical protein [Deltaproteobacteria bacterium]